MKTYSLIGFIFALIAALLNACIGIISLLLISSGLTPESIAFIKTILAYLLVAILLIKIPNKKQKDSVNNRTKNNKLLIEIAICSFLGVFILFSFETIAYSFSFNSPSNVVVILMASSSISALLFSYLLLKEKIFFTSILGAVFAIMGITTISWEGTIHFPLLLNASIAGIGYGIFTVLIKKFELNGGLYLTKYLLMFSSLYLLFPFVTQFDIDLISKLNFNVFIGILFLAIFPTILGFYCTTKALKYLSAANVQVTELSEPIFSALLAVIFFGTIPNSSFYVGALFIILGIALINRMIKFNK